MTYQKKKDLYGKKFSREGEKLIVRGEKSARAQSCLFGKKCFKLINKLIVMCTPSLNRKDEAKV